MKLLLRGHADRYALEQLQLSLFPDAPMEYTGEPFSGDGTVSSLSAGKTWLTASASITLDGKTARASRRIRREEETVRLRRRILQQSYYLAALQLLPEAPPWGALAGVRPTKLTTKVLLSGGTAAECDALLRDVYFVVPSRRRLCVDASEATAAAVALLGPTDLSLYIGIPFCPTRCAYCSFVSQGIERQRGLLEPFLGALEREIALTGELLAASPYRLRTVYVGGGTPTTLSAAQMGRLMDAVAAHFDLSRVIEYTVEGGRPDTLDPEKLALIRGKGAGRMSINPQSMCDEVLRTVGRRHTAADTVRAFRQAREAGFESINMDLIAGLPGDTPEGFAESLRECIGLGPSNLTVHTLALKRGSALHEFRRPLPPAEDVAAMLGSGETALRGAGYTPYYLYRQKYMSGSFENVGWQRGNDPGLYNIYMMEEVYTILSVGGGGMSKVILPGGKLWRQHNPKFPREYLDRLDETLSGRRELFLILNELEVKP